MTESTAAALWVVKLGGSIARSSPGLLRAWLAALSAASGRRIVVVPGGGDFADAVRRAQATVGFDDAAAHRMALLAMDQSAEMYRGLAGGLRVATTDEEIATALSDRTVAVWAPFRMAARAAEIPQRWDVTSDSLAAWLARRIGADGLLLVKSCEVPGPTASAERLAGIGVVDPAFPRFIRDAGCRWACADAGKYRNFDEITAAPRESP